MATWGKRLAWLAALAIVGAFIAGGFLQTAYHPLAPGTSWIVGTPLRLKTTTEGTGDRPVYSADYHDGETFRHGFQLRNSGLLPITLRSVDLTPGQPDTAIVVDYAVGLDQSYGFTSSTLRPVGGYVLQPGQSVGLVFSAVTWNCEFYSPGGFGWAGQYAIHYSTLGANAEQSVEAPYRLEVLSPKDCPRARATGSVPPTPVSPPVPRTR